MTADRREPSRDQLLAMAYVDGELSAEARHEMEARLGSEPALRREVAELQRLAVMTRQLAPPEPMDHEWEELSQELVHSTGTTLGWILAVIGTLGLGATSLVLVATSDMPTGLKFFLAVALAGFALLFLLTLRARLRTLPLDPYTQVKR